MNYIPRPDPATSTSYGPVLASPDRPTLASALDAINNATAHPQDNELFNEVLKTVIRARGLARTDLTAAICTWIESLVYSAARELQRVPKSKRVARSHTRLVAEHLNRATRLLGSIPPKNDSIRHLKRYVELLARDLRNVDTHQAD